MCPGIREWTQSLVLFLSCCVPQRHSIGSPFYCVRTCIVVEHCWHIFHRELPRRVGDEEAGLAHGAVAHHGDLEGAGAAAVTHPGGAKGGAKNLGLLDACGTPLGFSHGLLTAHPPSTITW